MNEMGNKTNNIIKSATQLLLNTAWAKKMADHYNWWLAFLDDLLTFNLLSQGNMLHRFH